jgi:hypothetical protein
VARPAQTPTRGPPRAPLPPRAPAPRPPPPPPRPPSWDAKLTTKSGAPLPSDKRARFFDTPANLAGRTIDTDLVWTMHWHQSLVDFSTYKLGLPGVPVHIDLVPIVDAQPLQIMAKNGKVRRWRGAGMGVGVGEGAPGRGRGPLCIAGVRQRRRPAASGERPNRYPAGLPFAPHRPGTMCLTSWCGTSACCRRPGRTRTLRRRCLA